jgi:hypothetical protein
VNSSSSSFGCGMGGGYGPGTGVSSIGTITLINSTVNAASSSGGCGLGSVSNSSSVGSIAIVGGTIQCRGARGEPSIGSSGVGRLAVSGAAVVRCESTVDCPCVVLGNGSLVLATDGSRLFATAPSRSGELSLWILYGGFTVAGTEPLQDLGLLCLHLGGMTLPDLGPWTFSLAGPGAEQSLARGVRDVGSLIASVTGPGNYSIFAAGDNVSGCLAGTDGELQFRVGDAGLYVGSAHFGDALLCWPSSAFSCTIPLHASRRPCATRALGRSGLAGPAAGLGDSLFGGATHGEAASVRFTDTRDFDALATGVFDVSVVLLFVYTPMRGLVRVDGLTRSRV